MDRFGKKNELKIRLISFLFIVLIIVAISGLVAGVYMFIKSKNITFSKDITVMSENNMEEKYSDYKEKYENKNGVKKQKAEQFLKQFLYLHGDDGFEMSQTSVKMSEDTEDCTYKVLNVRKISDKQIVAYIKITSGDYKDTILKLKSKLNNDKTYKLDIKSITNEQTESKVGKSDKTADNSNKSTTTSSNTSESKISEDKTDKNKKDKKTEQYILPVSKSRKLNKSDISGLSAKELRLARNEIYARHGRLFDDEELQKYFNKQDWYNGHIKPEDFIDSKMLSAVERYNAKFIRDYENAV